MPMLMIAALSLQACADAPAILPTEESKEAPQPEKTKGSESPSSPIQTVPAESGEVPKPAVVEPGCPAPGSIVAADLSMPVDQKFLDMMKFLCKGKRCTIIRYGDYPNETIKGKTPLAKERQLTRDNGFEEMFVFQHQNSKYSSFTRERGQADAERMQVLYPDAKTWYYGVDFDVTAAQMPAVKLYAIEFKKVADRYGKKVGAYGSGFTLANLEAAGLITFKWISQSTGFLGTREFTLAKKYHLLQGLPKKCGGKEADFNMGNPALQYFGQN